MANRTASVRIPRHAVLPPVRCCDPCVLRAGRRQGLCSRSSMTRRLIGQIGWRTCKMAPSAIACFATNVAKHRPGKAHEYIPLGCFFVRLGLFLSQQELTSRSSHRFSNVPAIPTCHSWAQGRGKKGRRHSGAGGMVAAGERCSWPRPVLSFPQKAVGGWWIVLALLGHSRLLQVG